MAEVGQAMELVTKAWNAVGGYPVWVKVLAVVVILGVAVVVTRVLGGEGGGE